MNSHSLILYLSCFSLSLLSPLLAKAQHKSKLDSTAIYKLDEVVVTAGRSPTRLKNSPVHTHLISRQYIEQAAFENIQEVLRYELPGMQFNEVGFGTAIQMQGLDAKHILFLVDGERLAGETGNNIDYSRLSPAAIERIEVVKGASSTLYGSQAMGAVVNIITKEPRERISVQFRGRYAQMNSRNYSNSKEDPERSYYRRSIDKPNLKSQLSLGLNLGKLKSLSTVSYNSKDAYSLKDREGQLKYFPTYNLSIQEEVDQRPHNISGYEDLLLREKLSYRILPGAEIRFIASRYAKNTYDLREDNKHERLLDHSLSGRLSYERTQHSIQLSWMLDSYHRYSYLEKLKSKEEIYHHQIQQPSLLYTFKGWEKHSFSSGLEAVLEKLATDKFKEKQIVTKGQQTLSAFVQDEWTPTNRLVIRGGLRLDHHDAYGFHTSPKLAILYKSNPFRIRINTATGYRSPSLKELYTDWDHFGMFRIYGNSTLKPETNTYLSLSGEYALGRMYCNLTAYLNAFQNKIEGVWKNDHRELHYINTDGRTLIKGLELDAKLKLSPALSLKGSLNLLSSQHQGGLKLTQIAPITGVFSALYTYQIKKLKGSISLMGRYTGKRSFDVLDEIQIKGKKVEAYYRSKENPYSIWRLLLQQQIYNGLKLSLGTENLFNYQPKRISFNSASTPGRRFFVAMSWDIGT